MTDYSGYRELGVQGGKLAERYMEGDKDVLPELLGVVEKLAINFLGSKVTQSRKTLTGLSGAEDAEDMLTKVQLKIKRALDNGQFKNENFKSWVLTAARNVFLDAIHWKRRPEGGDESAEKKLPRTFTSTDTLQISIPAEESAILYEKEILNIILDGLRAVSNPDSASIWTARVLLGRKEKDVCGLFERIGRLTRLKENEDGEREYNRDVRIAHVVMPGSVEEERVNRLHRRIDILLKEDLWPRDYQRNDRRYSVRTLFRGLLGDGPSLHSEELLRKDSAAGDE